MNTSNLVKFKNHLNTLIYNKPEKTLQNSVKPFLFLMVFSGLSWSLASMIAHLDHLSLHSLIGFPVFLMQQIASMSHIFGFALLLIFIMNIFINGEDIKKNIVYRKVLKEISGENIKTFFDDLYQVCENNTNTKYALQQIVNNLAANKDISLINLEFMHKHLDKTLKIFHDESENIDYFSQFEKESKRKNLQVNNEQTKEDKLQFFTTNQN